MQDIKQLVRKNVTALKPYSSARDEFSNTAKIYLDANENPFNNGLNRYPDPYQHKLKTKLSKLKNVSTSNILLGNGSDEVLDLLFRAFCEPRIDNVVSHNPSYGMYSVLAGINNVEIRKVNLDESFRLNASNMIKASDKNTKLFLICSPNNPSGNVMHKGEIKKLLELKQGLVIIDEAYIDFTKTKSWLPELNNYNNLVVCQTLSKAWGLAGLRVGICFASIPIIEVLNSIKPPYNINTLTQETAIIALENYVVFKKNIATILKEKRKLEAKLKSFSYVEDVFPSEANFLLIRVKKANDLYNFLIRKKIIVRNRSNEYLCNNCLRITVGTPKENQFLLNYLKNYAT